jgi:hypothetical protein
MAYSREKLVLLALEELGVPGAGQTPSAEDKKTIDDKLNSVMDDLAERNIYTWGDPDQTPDAAAIHLAVVMAQASARSFGVPKDEAVRLLAEARLRELKPAILSGQPQQAEYF